MTLNSTLQYGGRQAFLCFGEFDTSGNDNFLMAGIPVSSAPQLQPFKMLLNFADRSGQITSFQIARLHTLIIPAMPIVSVFSR